MLKLSHLSRTSLLIASFFLLDKVLAFVKSILFNKIVGLEGMGIFSASNNIPDYLSALLSGGALGMAFIPVLREYLDRQGRPAAWELFSRIINLAFILTAVISIIIIVLATPLVRFIIVPHFSPEKQELTASLMRLDLVAILIFSISGLVMSGLQANKHFLLPAMAPIFYNLGQIFGVTVLTPTEGFQIGSFTLPAYNLGLFGMVYGVIIGAGLHLLIQVPGLIRYKYHWKPILGITDPAVKRVLNLLWPRVLTMACIQAYFIARDNLASRFGEAGVGALNLGWTIQQVPETMIGTAIAIALLPTLAELISGGKLDSFRETVNNALRVILALCLPAGVLMGVSIKPLLGVFFNFEASQINLVTWCSWAFLLGLLGEAWLETAVRSFYANQNTRTPLVAAFAQVVTFIILAYFFSIWIGLAGIPLAASIAYTLQAICLLILLRRKFPKILNISGTFTRSVFAALIGGGVAFIIIRFLPIIPLVTTIIGLFIGFLISIIIIWKEIRLLLRL
jgi:putative peptidoglycan lipid II flippase